MLDHASIARLIPHQGTMCLLATAEDWSPARIVCTATSHLFAANPLRRGGWLAAICGCEYGFQAAALHGALVAGGVAQKPGFLAGLRLREIGCARLDDAAHGVLRVQADLEMADPSGLIYGFCVTSEAGMILLDGRATIMWLSA